MEALSKKEKEMLRQLNSDIQNVEGKAIPVSLTFAIFRWDLGEVIRWSPILTQEAQRSYGQVLRSYVRMVDTLRFHAFSFQTFTTFL